jgi:signal peptidase I
MPIAVLNPLGRGYSAPQMRHGKDMGRALAGAVALLASVAAGCGGGASEEDRARDAVGRYLTADAKRDAVALCGLYGPRLRGVAERAQKAAGGPGGCVAAIRAAAERAPENRLEQVHVLGVRLDGDAGRATVQAVRDRIVARLGFTLVREDGDWRIDGIGSPRTPDGRRVYTAGTEAMAPTLPRGHAFLTDEHAYDAAAPAVGDIVTFHPPVGAQDNVPCPGHEDHDTSRLCVLSATGHTGESFVKRVVAGPGDRIAFRGGHAIRNGRRATEPYVTADCSEESFGCDFPVAVTVPKDTFYLVGDDRGNSSDSRLWGAVPKAWIIGRVRP